MTEWKEIQTSDCATDQLRSLGFHGNPATCLQNQESGRFLLYFEPNTFPDLKRVQNIICTSSNGSVIWEAELPEGTSADYYTSLEVSPSGEQLKAFSFSCNLCRINIENGRLIEVSFTK